MHDQRKPPPNLTLEGEMQALRRAQKRARTVAARTGTPLVVSREGKVEMLSVDESEYRD